MLGNILVQRKKSTLGPVASCYHPSSWKKSYLYQKLKFGVFILFSSSAFFWVTSKWNLNLVASGSNLWETDPWVGHSLSLFLFAAKHSVCKKNLNIYPETLGADLHVAVVSVTMAEGLLLARHCGKGFTRTLCNPHSIRSGGSYTIMSTCVRDEKK